MELPPYRVPTAKAVTRNMWSKAKQYLQKMGGLILVASIIIWALSYFPRYKMSDVPESYKVTAMEEIEASNGNQMDDEEMDELILHTYQQEHSILGSIGKFCEPAFRPMELGWQSCVSLIAGMAAKEVVVSTMGVLYVGDDDESALSKRLQTPSPITGKTPFTTASALAFLVFVLLYFPCIATLTAIVRETGSWRYGLFSLFYNTILAWLVAVLTFNIASLF